MSRHKDHEVETSWQLDVTFEGCLGCLIALLGIVVVVALVLAIATGVFA